MRYVGAGIVGGLLGALNVLLVGLLTIQAIGVRAGGAINLRNEVVAITQQGVPVIQMALIAIVGGALYYLLGILLPRRRPDLSVPTRVGFLVATGILVVASIPIDSRYFGSEAWGLGVEGWIQKGGTSSAVHVLMAVILVSLVHAATAARRGLQEYPVDHQRPPASDEVA